MASDFGSAGCRAVPNDPGDGGRRSLVRALDACVVLRELDTAGSFRFRSFRGHQVLVLGRA
jgi:hypothetical protein